MFVESLSAKNFRNLAPLVLHLGPASIVVLGQNAQGKTNMLEALYVCATGRSFRNATPRELLQHGADYGELSARIVRQGVRHDVTVKLRPEHKSIEVDGRNVRQVTKLLELVNVVAFFPDDLRIVKGSPEERRRFLDRAIANHRTDFVQAALAYAKVLKSRNALLKAKEPPDRILLGTYDEQLIKHGAVMSAARKETLATLLPLARDVFARVMPASGRLDLRLQESVPGDGDFPARFQQALDASYPKDRARGMTSVGPHRDDVAMFIGSEDARSFASQGQQRTIVLSLKLAEVSYLKSRLGMPPVLLLDDVSSELDEERTRFLFDAVAASGAQVWLSSTGAAPLPLPTGAQRFRAAAGVIAPIS